MSWKEDAAEQSTRMAAKMLEQQGEINTLKARISELVADDHMYLGLATTRELLEKLRARGEVSYTIDHNDRDAWRLRSFTDRLLETMPMRILDYKTVGND